MKQKIAYILPTVCALLSACATSQSNPAASEQNQTAKCVHNSYDVAAIVWPAYHPAERWKELGIFGDGKGEWQNVYEAKPKFKGHKQPIVPLWGYENEADPVAVARKIDAALAAGINVFMYDWYWYGGRPFLEEALNDGFLKAPNNERMKFFLMWANHDVDNLWNNKIGKDKKSEIHWSADVSYDEFTKVLVPRFIKYFQKPNYYKIDNKPVLSIFLTKNLVRGMGGAENAKKAIEYLDNECKKSGFAGLHFMSMNTPWDTPIAGNKNPTYAQVAKYYGFESRSAYNFDGWNKSDDYGKWSSLQPAFWDSYKKDFGLAFPIVSTGWDNNPRFPEKDFTKICEGKSPAEYEKALRMAKDWADKNIPAGKPKLIFINAWNEWTEGEYLEPDNFYGYEYLNATARVFGK